MAAAGYGLVSLSRHGLHLRPGQLSPRIRTSTTGEAHTPRVSFDPLAPYGPVIESTVRVVTWSNRNPLAALGLFPDRRFDCILSAWPRRGGAGHPVRCSLLGVRPAGEQQISDHYGVVAGLRY